MPKQLNAVAGPAEQTATGVIIARLGNLVGKARHITALLEGVVSSGDVVCGGDQPEPTDIPSLERINRLVIELEERLDDSLSLAQRI